MHQSTLRVLKVLEFVVGDSSGKRLTDFSNELKIPKSTLLPILQTLCETQYLKCDSDNKYTAGTSLFSLGSSFSGCFPLLDYVHGHLQEIVEKYDETCYWGLLENGQVLYLDKVESSQPLRVLTTTGKRIPAYATSLGKALLIDKDEEYIKDCYKNGLTPIAKNTITDYTVLLEQLKNAKKDGYAWEIEESTEYIRCFAAPVFKDGKVVTAISIAIPIFRYDESKKDEIVATLKEHATVISKMISQTNAHFGSAF